MAESFQVGHANVAIDESVYHAYPEFVHGLLDEIGINNQDPNLYLNFSQLSGLTLSWHLNGEKKPLIFNLDFTSQLRQLKSFPAPKQGAFNQALGKKTTRVLDATGGWGADAFLMACQGYQVRVLERNPIMALMLMDAFNRAAQPCTEIGCSVTLPFVARGDSIKSIRDHVNWADCVYLDPMFPPKKKKSAAVNKQMRLLQWMVGPDEDAAQLLRSSYDAGFKRIAVKRPTYASPLGYPVNENSANKVQRLEHETAGGALPWPSQQFSSKLVHYDVYFQS